MIKSETEVKRLLQENQRLIDSEIRKYSTHIPEGLVTVEAYKLATEAAKSYDPLSNVKFSTYLVNNLKKLYRLTTQYGGEIRIPEEKQFDLQKVNLAEAKLEAELGRTPTVAELADETGLSMKKINDLAQNKKKVTNISKLDFTPVFDKDSGSNEWVHFVYHDLNPRDKLIFEHKTGFGGKPILDNATLAKKLRTSQTTIVSRVKLIGDKLSEGVTE